jgi:hypothetical protein
MNGPATGGTGFLSLRCWAWGSVTQQVIAQEQVLQRTTQASGVAASGTRKF